MARNHSRQGGFLAAWVVLSVLLAGGTAAAATLDWNGGVSGTWQNGAGGWLNGLSSANWNNATPDAAVFGGTTPVAVNISGGVTAGDITITNGAYAFGGSGTLTLNSGNIQVGAGLTAILSNAVAGTAGLTKTGAGTLVLTNNTKNFTGGTTISGGAVQITSISNGSLGSSNTATVVLNGGALHTLFGGNQNLSYNITVGASGGEIRNLGTDSQRATLLANKVIGSGTLTLSFGSVDTRIPVNGQTGFAGKWIVDSGGALNRYADIQTGASLGTGTGDDVLTLQNNGRILHRGGTLGGATQGITLGTGTSRVSIAGGQTVNIAGKLSGSVANGLDIDLNNSTSTGILSHTGNSFLGDLALYGPGFVLLGASGVLPDDGSVTVHTNATLDLNGYNEVLGGLSGMGTVNVRVASASVSLGVGANNSTSTFSGTLTNTASGASLQLVKVGSGTLVLSGTGIGHAGGTIISNGAIEISAAGAGRLGPASSSAVTLNGGTLQGNFSTHATVGNTITVGSAGGTLRNIGNDGQRWTMSADQLSGSGTLTLAFGSQNTRFVMASSQAGFTGKWIIDSAGNVNRFVDLNYASGNGFGGATGDDAITFENYGGILIREGLSLGGPSQGITLGSGRAKISVASTSTGTVAGKISGPAANSVQFYMDNSNSVLVLANTANNWAGASQINAGLGGGDQYGTLRLGAAGVLPDGGGAIEVSASGRLDLNGFTETIGGLSGNGRVDNLAVGTSATLLLGGNNSNVTFSGVITNSGASATLALTKIGTGTQTLSTAQGYAGLTTVSAGALRIGHADALGGSGAGTVVGSGGALELQGGITVSSESLTLNGSGPGGAGALRNISGNNIWQGALQLNNTSALVIASDSGDLKLRGAVTLTGSTPPTFQGGGHIFIETPLATGFTRGSGVGDVLISSGYSMTGDVVVAAAATGALKIEGALDGDVTMNGGLLTGSGTMNEVTLENGTISPGANGVTVLAMSALTLDGGGYQLNITNGTGTAGVNWDLLSVGGGAGTVDLSGAGAGSITVRVTCALAALPNFDYTAASWKIVDAGSVVGFSPAHFSVNTAAFTPGSEGGSWSVSSSGGDLYLEYAPPAATDLRVSISSLSPTVDVGTAVSLTLTVSNSGPAAASYVYLTNRIPATASYVGSSPSGSLNGSLVSWRLTNLAVGASQGVTLNLTAPLVDGRYTNELVAAFAGSDANPANNTSAFVITATCPGAPVPFLHSGTVQSVLATHLLSFNVVSSNSDCGVPDLTSSTLPAGASLLGATNGYASTAAFSWTPLVTQTGVHLVRFYASNIGSATTSFVVRIHVGGAGESTNAAGIPLSQTNWHVSITNIEIPASGNVTVVWDAVEGITYDVYYSDHNLGGAMSWTRAVSGLEADSETEAAGVSGSASQRYFQVVPEGSLLSSNNLWAVIRPTVNASTFTLVSPGTAGDRAFDGALGSNLAQVLTGDNGGVGDNTGDEVLILEANQSWRNLYLSGSNTWNESNGSLSTFELAEGQGFYVLRNSGSTAQPRFTGPVGNLGTSTNVITDNSGNGGWNIITFSQGRHIPASTAFGSLAEGSPEADWDETQADLILVLNSNGSWRRIMRAGDGTWFDLTSFTTTGLYFGPGTAVFYYRQPVGTMRVRF